MNSFLKAGLCGAGMIFAYDFACIYLFGGITGSMAARAFHSQAAVNTVVTNIGLGVLSAVGAAIKKTYSSKGENKNEWEDLYHTVGGSTPDKEPTEKWKEVAQSIRYTEDKNCRWVAWAVAGLALAVGVAAYCATPEVSEEYHKLAERLDDKFSCDVKGQGVQVDSLRGWLDYTSEYVVRNRKNNGTSIDMCGLFDESNSNKGGV
ncbi:MAG: hypothetical protein FJZ63_04355 [Chlamydiae bacterium]|nr:hypothetical protein [Chlamydiota bacterium]